MRSTTLATVVVLGLAGGALATPAEASGSWSVGADFSVGGVHFSLGYHRPHGHYGPYRPDYYYRTAPSFRVRGARCSSACYLDRGHAYHHPRCPVVGAHFGRHRFHVGPVWDRLGWSAWYGWSHPYGGWRGHHDRYRGWDRHYDDHHRHGRGRGHGHGRHHRDSCRHH